MNIQAGPSKMQKAIISEVGNINGKRIDKDMLDTIRHTSNLNTQKSYNKFMRDNYKTPMNDNVVNNLMNVDLSMDSEKVDDPKFLSEQEKSDVNRINYSKNSFPLFYNKENQNIKDTILKNDENFKRYGITPHNDGKAIPSLGGVLENKVLNWAQDKLDLSNIFNMGNNKKYKAKTEVLNSFIDVSSRFNTACVVLGDANEANREKDDYVPDYRLYYGQNQGYKLWKNKMAKWKDQVNQGFNDKLLDIGFEYWPTKNCAEDDALQKATSDGVNLEKAHLFTVGYNYKESKLEPKKSCLNCTAAFGSYIRDRNYSGWSEDMLDSSSSIREILNKCNKTVINNGNPSYENDIHKAEQSFKAINEW